ncbi:MAG: Flp pilus assembly complex ATPase component TadA [Phycisphaerales bacterium]|nr:Flp pilus assembly complex ATPase component TadA [Phycisphaerales bacterium]
MFDYLNLVYWLIALASLLAWARFSTFVAGDVETVLVDQPELGWKLGTLGALLAMMMVWVVMPSFWVALPVNVVIAGVVLGTYWFLRVKTLGPSGHLFRGALDTFTRATGTLENRRNANQVQLVYLRGDDQPLPLPHRDDPLAAGLATADEILIQALVRRAEQIEMIPGGGGGNYSLGMLVDGVAYNQPPLARTVAESAIQAFKVMSGLSVEERRRPQTGKLKTRDASGVITTWTVRSSGSTAGERLTIAANEQGRWNMKMDALGLTSDQLKDVKTVTADTQGIVLVASPKGHGQTSILYAFMRQHDAFMNSLSLFETDPKAEIEGATTVKFEGRGSDQTYAKALQSLFLKDPNVVLVSQVGDSQTADTISRFVGEESAHGRRVYVALTAKDAMNALQQWVSLNTDKAASIDSLRMVVAGRLVRILCPTCKIPYQPDESTLKKLNLPLGRNLQSFKANTAPIVDKKGNRIICPDCGGTGFHGRTGIFEVMVINDEMRKAMKNNANESQIKAIARKNHMILMTEHGIRKFATGITAINEVTRVMSADKPAKAGR